MKKLLSRPASICLGLIFFVNTATPSIADASLAGEYRGLYAFCKKTRPIKILVAFIRAVKMISRKQRENRRKRTIISDSSYGRRMASGRRFLRHLQAGKIFMNQKKRVPSLLAMVRSAFKLTARMIR